MDHAINPIISPPMGRIPLEIGELEVSSEMAKRQNDIWVIFSFVARHLPENICDEVDIMYAEALHHQTHPQFALDNRPAQARI
jgi:hypothetical protein